MWFLKEYKCILGVVAMGIFAAIAGTGCSEKPEAQAEEQLQQSTAKVLSEAEYEMFSEPVEDVDSADADEPLDNAIMQLDSAISKNRQAPSASGSALLAKANLTFTKAQKLHVGLAAYKLPVTKAAKSIVALNSRAAELAIQQEQINVLVEVNDEMITKLNELLDGSIETDGLKPVLAEKTSKLEELNAKFTSLEKQKEQLHSDAMKLQKQANETLLKAQNAAGEQKVALSKAGLDLTSQSNHKLVEVQKIGNEMELVQSKIDIVKPLIEKMQGDVAAAQAQIASIQDSPDFARLKGQLNTVKQSLGKTNGEVSSVIGNLEQAKSQYIQKADEVLAVLAEAIEAYEQVRAAPAREFASEKIAVCYFWNASVNAEKVGMVNHYSSILESVKSAVDEIGTVDVDRLIASAKTESVGFGKTAFENYDLAVEKYDSVSGDSEYNCYITKRHILSLYGKLMLAEQIGEYDISDKTAELIEPLVTEVQECDPDFSRTLVSKLIDGKTDFVPVLAIDNSEYYEGIRSQYQSHGWPKLPLDQREEAVRQLMANLEKLEQEETFDREAYENILGSEKQRLVAALEKGFEEEDQYDPSDPNTF